MHGLAADIVLKWQVRHRPPATLTVAFAGAQRLTSTWRFSGNGARQITPSSCSKTTSMHRDDALPPSSISVNLSSTSPAGVHRRVLIPPSSNAVHARIPRPLTRTRRDAVRRHPATPHVATYGRTARRGPDDAAERVPTILSRSLTLFFSSAQSRTHETTSKLQCPSFLPSRTNNRNLGGPARRPTGCYVAPTFCAALASRLPPGAKFVEFRMHQAQRPGLSLTARPAAAADRAFIDSTICVPGRRRCRRTCRL